MKIVINFEKRHFYLLLVLLIISSVAVVLAADTFYVEQGSPPSHDTLWTKVIRPKYGDYVTVQDRLNTTLLSTIVVRGKGALYLDSRDVVSLGRFSANSFYLWDDDGDGFIDYRYVSDSLRINSGLDCDDNNPKVYPGSRVRPYKVSGSEDPEVDYNCDGVVDLYLLPDKSCRPGEKTYCTTGNYGICSYGEKICQTDGTWGHCIQEAQPAPQEICNGVDDNCNGQINEGLSGCNFIVSSFSGPGTGTVNVVGGRGGSPLIMKTALGSDSAVSDDGGSSGGPTGGGIGIICSTDIYGDRSCTEL